MASKTIYENVKSDFYSVERAGYTTVSTLMYDVVTDLLNHGFTSANVAYVDITNATSYTTWPPAVGIASVSAAGLGYKAGDVLEKVGGTGTSVDKYTVSSINATGGITAIAPVSIGSYTISPPLTANVAFLSTDTTNSTTTVSSKVAVTAGSDAVITPPTPVAIITGVATVSRDSIQGYATNPAAGYPPVLGSWVYAAYPTVPDYHYADRADFDDYITTTIPTHQPDTVVWALGTASPLLKVGMLVFGTEIPADTTVISINPFQAVTGVVRTDESTTTTIGPYMNSIGGQTTSTATWYKYAESTSPAYYLVLSNPVTVTAAQVLRFRGVGAQIATVYAPPEKFTAIVEAGAAVDPLNDSVGVFANVATISTSSTTLLVNNMIGNRIYPGQLVNSTLLAGSISGVTTVVSVVNTGTSANVTLSSPQTLPDVGEQLHFIFVDTQPWRLAIEVIASQKCSVYAATPTQLTDEGKIATIANDDGSPIDKAGAMGNVPGTTGSPIPADADPDQGFINRAARVGSSVLNKLSYPMNYILTITNRGVFLGVWEGNWSTLQKTAVSTSSNFNWMLVQRPVNRLTGDTLTAGRAPVFCINSVGYKYWKFIVREADVLHPSQGDPGLQSYYYNTSTKAQASETTPYRVPADRHSADSFAILNTTNQIALTEDSKYLIGFLHNLTTPRFRYSEELDIIGQTSADVCGSGNNVAITAYSESGPRQYRALPSNNVYNTGLRICVLKDTPI